MKLCSLCHQTLNYSHFCKNKASLDGLNSICKTCLKQYRLTYRDRNKRENKAKDDLGQLEQPDKVKYCILCHAPKALTKKNFYTAYERPDGFNTLCIPCTKIRQKQPDRIYNFIKAQAKQKNRLFTITKEQHAELAKKPCFYCQENSDGWLDRKDSKLHYTLDNIVPSCSICNKMKRAQNSDEFINLCKKIASKH